MTISLNEKSSFQVKDSSYVSGTVQTQIIDKNAYLEIHIYNCLTVCTARTVRTYYTAYTVTLLTSS